MENRYTNIKHLGNGIIAFDTVEKIWLITTDDIGYRPTCSWLRRQEFKGAVHYHYIGNSRAEVIDKFDK